MRASYTAGAAVGILALFFVSAGATEARADGFLCSLWPWCKKESGVQGGRRTAEEIANDPVIADGNQAQKIVNNRFQFFKMVNKPKETGYVRIEYAFVGKNATGTGDGDIYEDSSQAHQHFLERSIIAWAKSLFVDEERTYIVTLSAKTPGGEQFWIEPIISFKYQDGFNVIRVNNSLRFNGNSVFYRPFDDEVEITIDVVSAENNAINLQLVESIFNTAGTVAGALGGPVFSVADIMAVGSYRAIIDQMRQKLQQFQSSTALTRKAVFKFENGRWFGFQYYFLAPGVEYTPFKLNVNLAFKKSLLDDRIAQTPNGRAVLASSSVLNQNVKPRTANAQQMRAYFSSSPFSSDVQAILASPTGSGAQACSRLSMAASDILQPHDVALAKLAFVQENIALFENKRTPLCFEEIDRLHLDAYNLSVPPGFEGSGSGSSIRRLAPISRYFNDYLEALAMLIKYTIAVETADIVRVSTREVRKQAADGANERPINIIDPEEIFTTGTPRMMYPFDLVQALLGKSFDKAGCFDRSIYSEANDPNVVGVLFAKAQTVYEARVQFDKMPAQNPSAETIKVEKIQFSKATPQMLAMYKSTYESRACQSGWTPPW